MICWLTSFASWAEDAGSDGEVGLGNSIRREVEWTPDKNRDLEFEASEREREIKRLRSMSNKERDLCKRGWDG
jgi:hypothetical protein